MVGGSDVAVAVVVGGGAAGWKKQDRGARGEERSISVARNEHNCSEIRRRRRRSAASQLATDVPGYEVILLKLGACR